MCMQDIYITLSFYMASQFRTIVGPLKLQHNNMANNSRKIEHLVSYNLFFKIKKFIS